MVHLDYRDARTIYAQIIDTYRSQISTGVLQNGDRLPSVRELASQLAINPNTIQRAYRELEMAGWIATVPGKGCFVCGIPGEAAKQQQDLLQDFDNVTAALLASGTTVQTLIARLQQGGNYHA